jgi:6-phosphogluconolactonase (cycloisomerase 2 family)
MAVPTRGTALRRWAVRSALLAGVILAALTLPAGVLASAPLSSRHLFGFGRVAGTNELIPFDVGAGGALTQRLDQAVAISSLANSLAVSRDARTIYIGSYPDTPFFPPFTTIPGTIQAFSVAAGGTLSLKQTVTVDSRGLVVAPDGTRLFVDLLGGTVVSYAIEPDGSLGAASSPLTVGGGGALQLALDSRGSALYVGTYNYTLEQYAIAADGSVAGLSPLSFGIGSCQAVYLGVSFANLDALCGGNPAYTFSIGAGGSLTQNGGALTMAQGQVTTAEDVRGRALYNAISPGGIQQFKRQADGTLAAFTPGSVSAPGQTLSFAADPSGDTLAVSSYPSALQTFRIAADGSLPSSPTSSIPTGPDAIWGLVYSPDQPPVAVLSAAPQPGGVTSFDASASHDADGAIARYDWSFGDGTRIDDAGSTVTHTYATPGDYSATVTESDAFGCSTTASSTYNGTLSICAGSPTAVAGQTVHVAAAPATQALATGTTRLTAPRPLTAARGKRGVLLTWRMPAGAPASTRYLVAWSTTRSPQGPGDKLVHRLHWTTQAHILMRDRRGAVCHFAVYAYNPDGTITPGAKTTLRLAS